MSIRFIHIVVLRISSFFFIAIYIQCMNASLFIHSLVDRPLIFPSSFSLSFKVPMNILIVWEFQKITSMFVIHRIQHQFSSVTQSCLTLCNPMNCSTPGLPIHHQLLESTQTHVHCVSDAIHSSHPLLSPSPPAFNLSQHQSLF